MVLETVESPGLEIGAKAPDFDLQGTDGKQFTLSSFNQKIVVLVFMSNGCPTVKAYQERLKSIQNTYGPQDVQLVGINSNNESLSPPDTFNEMVQRAKEAEFNFPYLKDPEREVAKNYGAICTPHVFVLDKDRTLRYKGRIDDARHESRVTSTDLINALDDLTTVPAGQPRKVRVPETTPFGCSIVW